jgi:hypothetical protein
MRVTIITDLNENSRIPAWLVAGVKAAERAKVRFVILTGSGKRKVVKP